MGLHWCTEKVHFLDQKGEGEGRGSKRKQGNSPFLPTHTQWHRWRANRGTRRRLRDAEDKVQALVEELSELHQQLQEEQAKASQKEGVLMRKRIKDLEQQLQARAGHEATKVKLEAAAKIEQLQAEVQKQRVALEKKNKEHAAGLAKLTASRHEILAMGLVMTEEQARANEMEAQLARAQSALRRQDAASEKLKDETTALEKALAGMAEELAGETALAEQTLAELEQEKERVLVEERERSELKKALRTHEGDCHCA